MRLGAGGGGSGARRRWPGIRSPPGGRASAAAKWRSSSSGAPVEGAEGAGEGAVLAGGVGGVRDAVAYEPAAGGFGGEEEPEPLGVAGFEGRLDGGRGGEDLGGDVHQAETDEEGDPELLVRRVGGRDTILQAAHGVAPP